MIDAIITVGLGFGDEGKGSAVDYLVREYNSKLVVRYNGAHQAAHTVVLPNGKKHIFSQVGSGTFAGADTFLGPRMIIELTAMANEVRALMHLLGKPPKIYIHPKCLVTTPYHKILNRAKEDSRLVKHGSCGVGVGETRKYWLEHGKDAIVFEDLLGSRVELIDKLELLHQRTIAQVYDLDSNSCSLELLHLYPTDIMDSLIDGLRSVAPEMVEFPTSTAIVVFEGAQGVLLDENYGFHPHTTWSTTTTKHAHEIIELVNPKANKTTIGIQRCFHTRHGNGPLPTERRDLNLVDINNPHGKYQGAMRFGYFDNVLFKYALQTQAIDGVFLTHCDRELDRTVVGYGNTAPILIKDRKDQENWNNALIGLSSDALEFSDSSAYDLIQSQTPVLYKSHGETHKDKTRI